MSKHTPRAGFSLLETIAVLFGFSMLMALSAMTIVGAFRIKNASTDALEKQGQRLALIDQFRADVAGAADAPEALDDLKADGGNLILRKQDGRHVVYRGEGGRVERWERRAPGAEPVWVRLEPAGVTAAFSRADPERRLVTLRLTTAGKLAVAQSLEITAALGGDLR